MRDPMKTGAAAYAAGRLADAEAAFRERLSLAPADADALSNLAAVLTATGRAQEAEAACRAALQARPYYWAALANLGNALHRQWRYKEAINAYHAAVEANPRNVQAWTNLGVALNECQDMKNARIAHDTAVKLAPDDAQIRTNRAMALLMAEDYAEGFLEFEWRWQAPSMAPHGLAAPQWHGEDPAGKKILLHAEGGFGDTLQFIRYAPLLAARGAQVVARVQPPLLRLLRQSMPGIRFTDQDHAPPHALHCPMLSLPAAFGTTKATIPAAPYLSAGPDARAAWASRLGKLGPGLKLGVAWQGAPHLGRNEFRAMDARRSIPADALSPLAEVAGVHLVSLQHGTPPPQAPAMLDAMAHAADFADTAAIVANLDLVISVDTAVAHLAGALGRPVWLLNRYDACWRWPASRMDSPWYPTMRLYRQDSPGNWAGVMARVRAALHALAAS